MTDRPSRILQRWGGGEASLPESLLKHREPNPSKIREKRKGKGVGDEKGQWSNSPAYKAFWRVLVCTGISDRQVMSHRQPTGWWARQGMVPVSFMQAGHGQGTQKSTDKEMGLLRATSILFCLGVVDVSEVVIFVTQRIDLEEVGGETVQGR